MDIKMENIVNMTISDYISLLSSKESMPGGGTTSAMTAVMGVSLYLMVINLSIESEKYLQYKTNLIRYRDKLESLKTQLLSLIDEDVNAFNSMIEVYNMAVDTEEQKKLKADKKQEALYICAKPPMKVMQLSLACLEYASKLIGITTKSAESDLIVGTINLKSAINSSYQNVLVNVKYMKDNESAEGIKTLAKGIVDKSKVIAHIINEEIKK